MDCQRCPRCLDPGQACLGPSQTVFQVLPECFKYRDSMPSARNSFCRRAMYACMGSGVLVSLPLFENLELDYLYKHHYHGQVLTTQASRRPQLHAEIIKRLAPASSGMTVAEVGTAAGWTLYHARELATADGKLIGFEADPTYHRMLRTTLLKTGIRSTQVVPGLFRASVLPPSSVDVFTSSHVLEHVADPCAFMEEVSRVLRPGGLVFTALPLQYFSPGLAARNLTLHNEFLFGRKTYTGQFHVSLFGREGAMDAYGQGAGAHSPFKRMMHNVGFEHVESGSGHDAGSWYAFRKREGVRFARARNANDSTTE